MNSMQCPQCGTVNDAGRALCANCQTPLTAYSGELRGESYEGKLAAQVDRLGNRPLSVSLMALYLVAAAVVWPLWAIVAAFIGRAQLNGESTNYLASAFGAIRPVMVSIVCLPIAAAFLWVAWSAFMQRTRGWHFALGALAVFATYLIVGYSQHKIGTVVGMVFTFVLAVLWTRVSTRSWFGLS